MAAKKRDSVPAAPESASPPETTQGIPAAVPADEKHESESEAPAGADDSNEELDDDTEAHDQAMKASTGEPSVLARFALPQNFSEGLGGVKKRTAIVRVTKPNRRWWWRIHPHHHLLAGLLIDETQSGKETYLVAPELIGDIGEDAVLHSLHGAITRQGVFFIIPVRLPTDDGRLDPWNLSLREAVGVAADDWVRTASSRAAGAYDVYSTSTQFEVPPWPSESWDELLDIAFKDRKILSLDHPILRALRGEV